MLVNTTPSFNRCFAGKCPKTEETPEDLTQISYTAVLTC
jgi:hypothetical protein